MKRSSYAIRTGLMVIAAAASMANGHGNPNCRSGYGFCTITVDYDSKKGFFDDAPDPKNEEPALAFRQTMFWSFVNKTKAPVTIRLTNFRQHGTTTAACPGNDQGGKVPVFLPPDYDQLGKCTAQIPFADPAGCNGNGNHSDSCTQFVLLIASNVAAGSGATYYDYDIKACTSGCDQDANYAPLSDPELQIDSGSKQQIPVVWLLIAALAGAVASALGMRFFSSSAARQ